MRATPPGAPARAPERRYAVLSFLQWLPVGLMMVPTVLLLLDRGLTLAEIAAVGAVSSITVAALELPTGGLADVLGRRPVLVVSALTHAVALVLLALSAGMGLLLVSAALRGASRALSSGPLEAWYVDAVREAREVPDTETDPGLTRGLARGQVASSVALGVGTLAGGALPLVWPTPPLQVPALALPILLAALVELVRVGYTVGIPDIVRRPGAGLAALRAVPATVRSGLRTARRDRTVLHLLLVAAATGVALAVLELVTPAWLDQLNGDSAQAALAYAVLVTVGFGADALGAALAPATRRLLAAPAAAAAALTVAMGAVVALAGATALTGPPALAVAGAAYILFFAALGASGPSLGELLHGRLRSAERTTVLSVESLAFQAAGGAGAVLAGSLMAHQGAWGGFATAAVALAAAALLLVRTTTDGRRVGATEPPRFDNAPAAR